MNNIDLIWFLSSSLASLGRRNFQWDLKGSDFDVLKSIQSIKKSKEFYTTLYHNIQNQINCQMIASIMDYEWLLLNPSQPRFKWAVSSFDPTQSCSLQKVIGCWEGKNKRVVTKKKRTRGCSLQVLRRLIKVSQLRLELMELMSKLRWPRFWSIRVLVIMMKREN